MAHARRMRAEGADIVDVGGESTRPGFDETGVTFEEERRRVMPVVRALVAEGFVVSVDTSKPELMREAAEAGAAILNDIRGFELPGRSKPPRRRSAGWSSCTARSEVIESGAVETVERYLEARTEAFRALGVDEERICWDPGVGFGKTVEENIALMAHSRRLSAHHPLMVACSREVEHRRRDGREGPDGPRAGERRRGNARRRGGCRGRARSRRAGDPPGLPGARSLPARGAGRLRVRPTGREKNNDGVEEGIHHVSTLFLVRTACAGASVSRRSRLISCCAWGRQRAAS